MKATEPAVKEYAGYFLSEQKIPCSIYFVEKIPRSSLGKLQRRKLESQLNIRDREAKKACGMSKAGSGLADEVLELYREHLKLADILPQGNFFCPWRRQHAGPEAGQLDQRPVLSDHGYR